jgi:hypothetical protein
MATRRLRDPANRCRCAVCARSARICGAGLDLARRRACAPPLLLRPCAPVRGRAAPRRRPRRSEWNQRARTCEGCRDIRRHGSDRREDRLDRNAVRVHRDARAPRLDRRQARGARDRARRRRHRGAERRGRSGGAVRLPRPTGHGRGPGLCRSAHVPAGATLGRRADGATRADRRARCRAHARGRARRGAGGRRARGSCGGHSGGAGSRRVAEGPGNRRGARPCGERRSAGGGRGAEGRASCGCNAPTRGRARRGHRRSSVARGAGPQQAPNR